MTQRSTKVIRVSSETYNELVKERDELGLRSFDEVIRAWGERWG